MNKQEQEKNFVQTVITSAAWRAACNWGKPRPGHPEGTVGRHVEEQLLPVSDRWYRDDADYWNLVALSYLHDIGKPVTVYKDGRLAGDSHSLLSARIAEQLGAPDRLVQVVLSNDRAYSYWRKLLNASGVWTATRWTEARRAQFRAEFGRSGLDLRLLVLFHRADNAYRRAEVLIESEDPVLWFEQRLLEEGLMQGLPEAGRDQRQQWPLSMSQ